MRRLIYLLLLAVFVGASVSGVSASTDCERWFVAYRQELAHSRQLQRVAAAQRRAKLYARRKLAGYVRPAPKPHPVVAHSPRMTPRQTLRHFDLACGILPEEQEDAPTVAEEIPAEFHPEQPLGDGVDLLPAGVNDMVAENTPPALPFVSDYPPNESGPSVFLPPVGGGYMPPGTAGYVPPGGGTSVPPGGGTSVPPGGTTSVPPGGGTTSVPPGGGTSVPPDSPTSPPSSTSPLPPSGPVVPPIAVVPEPASYVFLLTGLLGAAGAAGVGRRRVQA